VLGSLTSFTLYRALGKAPVVNHYTGVLLDFNRIL
jgi:hypothetical protein